MLGIGKVTCPCKGIGLLGLVTFISILDLRRLENRSSDKFSKPFIFLPQITERGYYNKLSVPFLSTVTVFYLWIKERGLGSISTEL